MAILFCRAQVIKRSEGRSAVACAAYRGGVTLTDERTGQLHDYSRKKGTLAEGILAPDKAPAWAKDPQELWNRVEAAENRKDAQLARELVIALPHELDDQHREYLVKNVLRHATRQGMIAHYAIHAPGREGDERNHHAHIMLTLRRMTPEGFEATKAREWNEREALHEWKRTIEHETNRMMERQGLEQRVSVELEEGQRPTRHLGPRAAFLERRGIKTELGEQNREAAEANTRRKTLERLKEQTAREIAALEKAARREEEAREQERQREERRRRIAREKEEAEAARRERRENKLRVFLRLAFARARAATLREAGDLEGAAKIEENLAREAGQKRYGERVTREQSHTFAAHLEKEAARAEMQRQREEALKEELGVDRLAKDCPDWSREHQDPDAWRNRMNRIPREEQEARAKVAGGTAYMKRDEIDEGIRELWDCTRDAEAFRVFLERAGLLLARQEGTEDARGQPRYVVIDGAGRGYALSESFGRGNGVVRQRMAGLDPSIVPPVNEAQAIQRERVPVRPRTEGLDHEFNRSAASHERTEEHVAARMNRVERLERERQARAHEAERGAQAFDHEQQRRADRPKDRPAQVENAEARRAEREALERRHAEDRARLDERQRERLAAHERGQPIEARQSPPTPAPTNENRPEAHQKQREHVPLTPAARAFEKAQQPERTPQPEPPERQRTEQRDAFNAAASAPREPEQEQKTRRQGEGEGDRTQAHKPANENKRRPRAQTAEEMRERMKNRSGRKRTRDRD